MTTHVLTGIDLLREGEWKKLKGLKLGLLANQASLDRNLNSTADVIAHLLPGHLKALFGPQHGYAGHEQENMIETPHGFDHRHNIPQFSLYGETRIPLPHMFEIIDLLIIDLQDVGARVYTFASTMLNCLKSAARAGVKVLVLDRPNPLGGNAMEGNLLRPELYSFVGPCSIPMRHGLTMGELAVIFNTVFGLSCDLEIVPMRGWRRELLWKETGLIWAMPSPNMPLSETAAVYPGQVLWEGTNLSEGRGTCRPFEIFGAPFLDATAIEKAIEPKAKKGCYFQKYSFRPTFHKWNGEICNGFMLHVMDPHTYKPFFVSIAILKAVMEIHYRDFEWKKPPYEYEYHKRPIDIILGDSSIRQDLESGMSTSQIQEKWLEELKSFAEWRKAFLLY